MAHIVSVDCVKPNESSLFAIELKRFSNELLLRLYKRLFRAS